MENLNRFFKKFGIRPHNKEVYEMAFTHSSFNSDAKTLHHDYERLEFIGDSVLGFVVASMIFKAHPEMSEGNMTKAKASLVKTASLASKAKELGYEEFIRVGNSMSNFNIKNYPHIFEDIFESVIGAIYLDQGFSFVEKFIIKIFKNDVENFDVEEIKDYKSQLQEAMQAEYRESVEYRLIDEIGPTNNRIFVVEVTFNNLILGKGSGRSKKEAEQNAAKDALSKAAR